MRYAARLKLMSEWLVLAGQERDARLALSASRTMIESPPEANLFAQAHVQKGILVAVNNILAGGPLAV
jgi:hypothetical protein